jgi:predicted DNA-binding antitoxin AbrB/MazE fold protein
MNGNAASISGVSLFVEEQSVTKSIKAVYENGVFRPLEPVPFKEHEILNLTVSDSPSIPEELLDTEFFRYCESQADDRVTIEEVRAALSKIPGSMAEEIRKERDDRV